MLFSTPVFLFFFLPISLVLYFALGQRNVVLLLLSLVFYAWGEPILVIVMLGAIVWNYLLGFVIDRNKGDFRKAVSLTIGVAANLALLIVFKYLDFLVSILNPVLLSFNVSPLTPPHLPLPLGVSFFTFQAISYLIDVYRGQVIPQRDVVKFALFKTLYPQLIAGPIVRYTELSSQLANRRASLSLFAEGLNQFCVGLAKKVIVADVVAASVDQIFGLQSSALSGTVAWTGVLLFMIQIYFDFSGYTDMALGLSKMLGFRLPPNFNYPYSAQSIQDFWRRWHMTLSRWFRDYLYIPLGGNRGSNFRTYSNLVIVFALCGLWHGPNFTFLIWGLYHGAFLILERTRFGNWQTNWPTLMRHCYVLFVVAIGWLIFRATSVDQIGIFLHAMAGLNGWSSDLYPLRLYADNLTLVSTIFGCIFSFPIAAMLERNSVGGLLAPSGALLKTTVAAVTPTILLLLSLGLIGAQTHRAFIYFRF